MTTLVITIADPAHPPVRAMVEELDAYLVPLYPAESNHLLDIETLRQPGVLVVPRDALRFDGEQVFVRVRRGNDVSNQAVTLGAMNAHEAVVTSGLADGAVVERNALAASRGSR